MSKSIIFLFFLFFSVHFVSAQEGQLALEDSIGKYLYNNPDKAISYLKMFLNENIESENIKNQAIAYSTLAICHDLKSNIDSTFYYYYKGLSIVKDPEDIIQLKYNIGLTYEKTYSYDEALQMYSQCLELASGIQRQETIENIKLSIASIKSKIGKPDEALELLKGIYIQRKKESHPELKFTRKELAETYLKTNNSKEANNLIDEGLKDAKLSKDYQMLYYLYDLKHQYHFMKDEYETSKKHLDSAQKSAESLNNLEFIENTKFNLAEVYYKQSQYDLAVASLKSILVNDRVKTPEQNAKYYKLLGIVYKDMDSLSLSAEYYQKYISEDEKVSKKRIETLDKIHNIKLGEEIKKKEQQQQKTKYWTISSAGLLILALFMAFRHVKNSKRNQVRFDNLMQKIKTFEENRIQEQYSDIDTQKKVDKAIKANKSSEKTQEAKQEVIEEINTTEDSSYAIDDSKVEEILKKIQRLEEKKYFLKQDCTLHNMSKKLKTNTSYLSKIINSHLNKSFSTYINELRINYAILELKNNKRLRAYSVKGIAQEMGYKNADSFSKYFKAATGITPSVYINKIKNLESDN